MGSEGMGCWPIPSVLQTRNGDKNHIFRLINKRILMKTLDL